MQAPAAPPDEMARLLALHKLQILDTESEERFDRITRITQRAFGADICLVSLVDVNRQWFKSRQGLEASETPRSMSFCGHAILDDKLFVIDDTSADERFADNPLVTGSPHIRFYAGCPIRDPKGHRVGTLCVIDRKPRQFEAEEQAMLSDLSALVEGELEDEPQSIVDEVTNVANRRGFDAVARHLFNLCRRLQGDAQAIVIGIDGLSDIGDERRQSDEKAFLRRFAETVQQSFPTADLLARIAPDKFAVLVCADSDSSAAGLQQLTENSELQTNSGQSWSVGCSNFDPQSHLNIESLMNEADKLMQKNRAGI